MTFAEYVTGHRAESDHAPMTAQQRQSVHAGHRLFGHLRTLWGLTSHDPRSYMRPAYADDAKGVRVKRYSGHYLAGEGCTIVVETWRRQQGAVANWWSPVATVTFECGRVTGQGAADLLDAAEAALRGDATLPAVAYPVDAERDAQYTAHLAEEASARTAYEASIPYWTSEMAGLLTRCRWALRDAEKTAPWHNPTQTLQDFRAEGARRAVAQCVELRERIAHVRETTDTRAEEMADLERQLDALNPRVSAALAALA